MDRRSNRLVNKEKQKAEYFTFVPELDFSLTNPIVFTSKHNNELCKLREMLKQLDASDLVNTMEKEINTYEMHEYWKIVP